MHKPFKRVYYVYVWLLILSFNAFVFKVEPIFFSSSRNPFFFFIQYYDFWLLILFFGVCKIYEILLCLVASEIAFIWILGSFECAALLNILYLQMSCTIVRTSSSEFTIFHSICCSCCWCGIFQTKCCCFKRMIRLLPAQIHTKWLFPTDV